MTLIRSGIVTTVLFVLGTSAFAQEPELPPRPDESRDTRLLIGPTGRSLRKGEGYVAIYDFLFPAMQFGLTNRFSIGIASMAASFHLAPPIAVAPKLQIVHTETTSTSIGIVHAVFPGHGQRGTFYLANTIANGSNSGTSVISFAYSDYRIEPYFSACASGPSSLCSMHTGYHTYRPGRVDFQFGAEHRASSVVSVVAEIHGGEHGVLPTVGVKLSGDRITVDLAGSIVFPYPFIAPMLNLTWRFGA